jgi:caspase domain-containing protein
MLTATIRKIDLLSNGRGPLRVVLALACLIVAAEGLFFLPTAAAAERIALVIGNANYHELGVLPNASADAKAIDAVLQQLGYETQLVTDASDASLRREVRKFAASSDNTKIALVFYAGHGAQVNGDNYLLPVDIGVPQHDSDIRLAGLKVDDLVNSIRSETKVVFLDACRDNPSLFKNLIKGRGGRSVGLAPTVGSNLSPPKPGGGVFIAYATDSGAVALDGQGDHSPFTQALLDHLKEPVSIDDMFSLVTKEVRLATQDAQRPYKYASLEGIVCLAGSCRTSYPVEDPLERAKNAEAEEAKIALETRNPQILEAYLQKNPASPQRPELVRAISSLLRAEHDEWTLFELLLPKNLPVYLKINSIEQLGDSVVAQMKFVLDPSSTDHPPDGSYQISQELFSCTEQVLRLAQTTILDKKDNILYHYKWADPKFLEEMVDPTVIAPGSVFYSVRNVLCDDQLRTPLVQKQQLLAMKFPSLASTPAGDGETYYKLYRNDTRSDTDKVVFVTRYYKDKDFREFPGFENLKKVPGFENIGGILLIFRTTMSLTEIDCSKKLWFSRKTEFYDVSGNLVAIFAADPAKFPSWLEIVDKSPMGLLRRIVCHEDEGAK